MSDIVQALKDGCPTRPSGDGIGWEYNIEAADMIMERASEELTRLRSLNAELVTALKAIKRAQAKLKQARLSNDLEAVQSASGEIAKQAMRALVLSDELARLTSVHRRRSRLTGVRS